MPLVANEAAANAAIRWFMIWSVLVSIGEERLRRSAWGFLGADSAVFRSNKPYSSSGERDGGGAGRVTPVK